jgi:Tfp pilus assembly protein PilO
VKRKQIPLALVFAIVVLIAAVAGYMLLIRPKAAEVEKLDEEIAALETQRQAASLSQGDEEQPQTTIKVADLVELAKAMPEQVDMAGAILELNAAAKRAGVEFTSIQPGAAAPGLGYVQLPLALTYVGNYYDLTELLYQLRQLVTVREGVLDANGRLFTLDSLDWHEAEEPGFPIIEANLVVSAYVYGNDAALLAPLSEGASATTAPTETTGGTTTPPEDGSAPSQGSTSPEGGAPTTTTPTTTTPPATVDAGAQAAGATP